jgi:hypothetical protein
MKPTICIILGLALFMNQEPQAQADLDLSGPARGLVGQLNPVNVALGPVVDDAISKGNVALAQRLEQLRAIIQEALFTLDQIATKQVTKVNADTDGRIKELQDYANQNQLLFQSIINGTITQVDDATYKRILQAGDTTGNLIQSLPIPADPLPDVPPTGFALVKEYGETNTTLFVTGVGLYKDNYVPRAYLLSPGDRDTIFSYGGKRLDVPGHSMGLLQIEIPNDQFPDTGSTEKTLHLHLSSSVFGSVDPTFPVYMCSSLPQYFIKVTQTASGQYWDHRRVPYPSPRGRPDGVYIDDNGSNNSTDVCATDFGGWQVDPEAANNGLEVGSSSQSRGEVTANKPRPGCYHLYAGRDSGGGGNAQVGGVFVHQRRLLDGQCGDAVSYQQASLKYGNGVFPTTPKTVISQCVSTTDGAAATATLQTNVVILDAHQKQVDQVNLLANVPAQRLNGDLTLSVDSFGLIQTTLTSKCRRVVKDYGTK